MSQDRAAAAEMIKKSGQYGVPVIVADGEVIVGFDKARIEALIARQTAPAHPSFGASVADAAGITGKQGSEPISGAYVGAARPGSAAEKAGLQRGDIIIEVNLSPIKSASDLEKAVEGLTEGAKVNVVFLRGQETLRGEATL